MDTTNNKQHLKLPRLSTIFRSCRHNDTTTSVQTPSTKTLSAYSNPKHIKPPTHPFPSIHKPTINTKPDSTRQKLSSEIYNYSLFYSAHSAPLLEKQSMQKHTPKKHSKYAKNTRRKYIEMKKASSFETSSEDDEVGTRSFRTRMRTEVKKIVKGDDQNDCYAIVKCSKDPYMDFRKSMVEMIVEKRMKKGEDLERLLQCFLKLNSYRYHPVIIEAFMGIWDALFVSNSSAML